MTRMSRMRACRCGHSRERNAPDREGASSRQMFGRHRKECRNRIVERGGPVFFGSYAGRRAGRLRIGYPATPAAGGRPHRGIRRHLPPDAARTGNPANDGMPKAGPDGPVRGNRSVGSGRYGWAGIRPAASRGTVGGRPVVGGSHTTGSCGCPAGNLQMLPRKVQRPGRCRRLFAETGIRYPRRGRTTPLPETNPAPSETLPAEAECRRQGWRTGGGRLSGASA